MDISVACIEFSSFFTLIMLFHTDSTRTQLSFHGDKNWEYSYRFDTTSNRFKTWNLHFACIHLNILNFYLLSSFIGAVSCFCIWFCLDLQFHRIQLIEKAKNEICSFDDIMPTSTPSQPQLDFLCSSLGFLAKIWFAYTFRIFFLQLSKIFWVCDLGNAHMSTKLIISIRF